MIDAPNRDYSQAYYKAGTILRDVFLTTHQGKQALGILLRDMGYFSMDPTGELRPLRDFAQGLLIQMGVISDGNLFPFIEKMASLPDDREPPLKE